MLMMPKEEEFGTIDETERNAWDPNDPNIFEVSGAAEWLQDKEKF